MRLAGPERTLPSAQEVCPPGAARREIWFQAVRRRLRPTLAERQGFGDDDFA